MATLKPSTFTARSGKVLTLRSFEATDIDAFFTFLEKIAEETTHTLQKVGRPMKRERVLDTWEKVKTEPGTLFIAAFDEATSRLIGEINIRKMTHPWTQHMAEFGMMMLKEFWGQGLGPHLLTLIETFARENGVTRIEAKVRTLNERGVGLYKKMGYKIEGTRERAALIDGQYQDEYFIAKLLD